MKRIFRFLFNGIFNPVTFISVFSLIIYNNTMRFIRAEIGVPYGMTKDQIINDPRLSAELKQLGLMLNDGWNYAMSDYTIQILMLLVATILAGNLLLNRSKVLAKYPLTIVSKEIYEHHKSLAFYFISFLFFAVVFIVFFSNLFASVDILRMYLPNNGTITGKTRMPPIESGISWVRYSCGFYGVYMSYYFNNNYTVLLNKLQSSM